MPTSDVGLDEPATTPDKYAATHRITEDTKLKELQRIVPNRSDGSEFNRLRIVTATRTRPANTTAYVANYALSDSLTAPTALTFSNVVDGVGRTGYVGGLVVSSSFNQSVAMQAELWLFHTAPAVIIDGTFFTITDAEYANAVACIPFALDRAGVHTTGTGAPVVGTTGNVGAFLDGRCDAFKTVGSANLTGLVKILNAYVPGSGEVLTFNLKVFQVD